MTSHPSTTGIGLGIGCASELPKYSIKTVLYIGDTELLSRLSAGAYVYHSQESVK